MHAHVEVRGHHWHLLLPVISVNLELTMLASMDVTVTQESTFLCRLTSSGIKSVHCQCWLLKQVLGIQIQVLMLLEQALNPPSNTLPAKT